MRRQARQLKWEFLANMTKQIEIPEFSLVALVGSSSSGKSTFAQKYFKPTEVLSSDFFRGMICDDENDQSISAEAFDLLYYAAQKRLKQMKLTVIDATNIKKSARARVLALAHEQNVHAVAIVLNMPENILLERNKARAERRLPAQVIRQHARDTRYSLKNLRQEGFRFVYEINTPEELEDIEIIRQKLWTDKRSEHGPFDIIGDIHGCYEELKLLLAKLGYEEKAGLYYHPAGRRLAFLGDFCDRGAENIAALKLVMRQVKEAGALAVPGNHDAKLLRYLNGKNPSMQHGFDKTEAEFAAADPAFKKEAAEFIDSLISHYVLDDGKLVITHAGIKEEYIGRTSACIREFCLYGETSGEPDEYGLPQRIDWAADYRGRATIVYGHISARKVVAKNNTYCIDTGCAYGGKLSALRYPEREIVSVPALKQYAERIKPWADEDEAGLGDLLTLSDVNKKLHIETELMTGIDIHENNSAAALEIMSRFAADPHWLIYLPPTMSPCETSPLDDYLEHPLEAFEYYKSQGVQKVICEQKHMGSRAVIVLCDSPETAARRFGIKNGERGIIYTRTGRRFFSAENVEKEILGRLSSVLRKTGFYADFKTDWLCLDCELMPWSEKAKGLILSQYATTGNAAKNSLKAASLALKAAAGRPGSAPEVAALTSGQNVNLNELVTRYQEKAQAIEQYIKAYREYSWPVNSVNDFRLAPFHILATEGQVFGREKHSWHMENIRKYFTGIDNIFIATPYLEVDTADSESVQAGVSWWLKLTASGGEGMVVKPETYTAFLGQKLLQPAIKCRGREYLRIIYGPEYLTPEHLKRLKVRSLNHKRRLALKEFALGLEGLNRFVKNEPLYRVHECAFGVLALESEPVDPRL